MKKTATLILIFTLFITNAQNILSALNYNEKYDVKESKPIDRIVKSVLFYNKNSTEESTEITYLNDNFRVLKEERFNSEGELKYSTQITYKNDSIKIGRFTTTKIPLLGNQIEYTTYDLDTHNFLINIIKKNKRNQIFETVHLENDEHGNPVFLKLNEGQFGYEKATYDYENNLVTVYYYNKNDEVITTNSSQINYSKDGTNNLEKTVTISDMLLEYKYDKYGNWIKETRYQVAGKNKTKKAVFTRKIYYR